MDTCWNFTHCCPPINTCKCPPKSKKKLKYIPPPRTQSCRPLAEYVPPEGKMQDQTVYRMSYTYDHRKEHEAPCQFSCPQCCCQKIHCNNPMKKCCGPATCKKMFSHKQGVYVPPKMKMDDQTVHRLSYGPPGQYVECTDDESDCIEWLMPPPCMLPPPCEGPNVYCCCQDVGPDNEVTYIY